MASPGVDPVIGRYRMVSSEGFDNFMKALNVGVVKRKMANSVTPVNVIDITPEGWSKKQTFFLGLRLALDK